MTLNQDKLFWKLISDLGYDKTEAKEHAKKKYGVEHFMQLTSAQIDPLIKILEGELLLEARSRENKEKPQDDFPDEFRIWDGKKMTITPEKDPITDDLHFMQWTGLFDDSGQKLYDQDWIENYTGHKYLIGWSWKDAAWCAFEENTNMNLYLASMGKKKKLGSIYDKI